MSPYFSGSGYEVEFPEPEPFVEQLPEDFPEADTSFPAETEYYQEY